MDPAYDMQSHEKQVLVNDSLIPEDNAQNPSLPSRGSSNNNYPIIIVIIRSKTYPQKETYKNFKSL